MNHVKTIANTSIRRRVATTARRQKDGGRHSHGRAAPRPHPGTPRPRHDGHVQGRHSHGHDMTARRDVNTIAPAQISHDTPEHNRTNVPTLHHATNTPRGGASPRRKKQGRWLSSADAECSLEHFWITRYLRSLHIFSGCNRFCTLHIVYNVPWIDVDGGRAQLGSASISGCYHSLRVA